MQLRMRLGGLRDDRVAFVTECGSVGTHSAIPTSGISRRFLYYAVKRIVAGFIDGRHSDNGTPGSSKGSPVDSLCAEARGLHRQVRYWRVRENAPLAFGSMDSTRAKQCGQVLDEKTSYGCKSGDTSWSVPTFTHRTPSWAG